MSNTNKSGFEIRADLLNQAQGLLEMNAQRKVDAVYFKAERSTDEVIEGLPEVMITAQDIIETARQLNEFVNEK